MTAEIIRHPASGDGERWDDIEIKLPPPMPRIEPGRYQAISVRLVKFHAFKRDNLRLDFDVFAGEAGTSEILARVPLFVRLPGPRGLTPSSKLARLLYLAGARASRWQRVSLEPLRGKLWLVDVADAQHDTEGELPAGARYSVVRQVLERL